MEIKLQLVGKIRIPWLNITPLMARAIKSLIVCFSLLLAVPFDTGAQESASRNVTTASFKSETNTTDSSINRNLSTEVEILKQRVEDLENQNRTMLQLITDLKARLEENDRRTDRPNTQPARTNSLALTDTTVVNVGPPPVEPPKATVQADKKDSGEFLRWTDLIGEKNKFKIYGFLRVDLNIDSQRPNNGQAPLFITSADPRVSKEDAGLFSMTPRLTRFGINYSGPEIEALNNGKLSGQLETDFENGGSESRQIIRIRHAFLKLTWNDFSILGGQTWDMFSPLFPTVNNDTLMWNTGNTGDRRPQVRFAYEPKVSGGQLSFIGGVGLTNAIDPIDLDNNGFRDGEESGLPNAQGRIGYSHQLANKDQRVSFGVSGYYAKLNTTRPVAGRTDFRSQLLCLDYTLALHSRFSLRGESWWGRNMSDIRGGAGQSINLVNGREIHGRGGWVELSLKPSRYLTIYPGFTIDDPNDIDVPATGRTRNRAFYIANRVTLSPNFVIGLDYLRWKTNYKGLLRGLDNRGNIFLQYSF
jgi:hypothetical protein